MVFEILSTTWPFFFFFFSHLTIHRVYFFLFIFMFEFFIFAKTDWSCVQELPDFLLLELETLKHHTLNSFFLLFFVLKSKLRKWLHSNQLSRSSCCTSIKHEIQKKLFYECGFLGFNYSKKSQFLMKLFLDENFLVWTKIVWRITSDET